MTRPYTPRELFAVLNSCRDSYDLRHFSKAYREVRENLPLGMHLVLSVFYKSKLNKLL